MQIIKAGNALSKSVIWIKLLKSAKNQKKSCNTISSIWPLHSSAPRHH